MWAGAKNGTTWYSGLVQKHWADTEDFVLRVTEKGKKALKKQQKSQKIITFRYLKKKAWKFSVLLNAERK